MNWHDPADVARLEAMRDVAMPNNIYEYARQRFRYEALLANADPLARIRELEAENARLREAIYTLESREAGLADTLNSALRENYGANHQVKLGQDMRDAIWRLAEGARYGGEFQGKADLAALRDRHQRAIVAIESAIYTPGLFVADHPELNAILDAEQEATPSPKEPQHVCGLSGYNGMIDPPCPGCEARIHRNDTKEADRG